MVTTYCGRAGGGGGAAPPACESAAIDASICARAAPDDSLRACLSSAGTAAGSPTDASAAAAAVRTAACPSSSACSSMTRAPSGRVLPRSNAAETRTRKSLACARSAPADGASCAGETLTLAKVIAKHATAAAAKRESRLILVWTPPQRPTARARALVTSIASLLESLAPSRGIADSSAKSPASPWMIEAETDARPR